MENRFEQPTVDILSPEEFRPRADAGKRFLNYVIDLLLFYVLFFTVGVVIALLSPSALESLESAETPGFVLVDRLLTLVLYALYMSVIEALFKGRSLGKLVTGTRAVNLDGSRISTGTAFARGFSRAVPFCVFSAFGSPSNPWQDKWTDTMVVEERKNV